MLLTLVLLLVAGFRLEVPSAGCCCFMNIMASLELSVEMRFELKAPAVPPFSCAESSLRFRLFGSPT